MRNLLVRQESLSPLAPQIGIHHDDNSARLLGIAQGLDRKQRYEKMVESIYGEPGAANRLLLKTLCVSAMDEQTENLEDLDCVEV